MNFFWWLNFCKIGTSQKLERNIQLEFEKIKGKIHRKNLEFFSLRKIQCIFNSIFKSFRGSFCACFLQTCHQVMNSFFWGCSLMVHITKFGYILFWMVVTLFRLQNWKKKKCYLDIEYCQVGYFAKLSFWFCYIANLMSLVYHQVHFLKW